MRRTGHVIAARVVRVAPLLLALSGQAGARAAPVVPVAASCERAIAATEQQAGTPPGLLRAIGLVESGRRDQAGIRRPWPWTVTAEGVGSFYPSKAEAIAAVVALQARGVSSIDVGCMQVNLQFHPEAFRTLEDAFDPVANTRYAARFLRSLFARLDDWPAAAAAYHSFTPGPAAAYAKLIAAVWSGAPVPVVRAPDGEEMVQFPGGGVMRVFRDAGSGGRIVGVLN